MNDADFKWHYREMAKLDAKIEKQNSQLAVLRAENAKLRAALEHCLREHGGFTIRGETERIARAALNEETK